MFGSRLRFAFAVLCGLGIMPVANAAHGADVAEWPAAGRHESIIEWTVPGRVAVMVTAPDGLKTKIFDPISGPQTTIMGRGRADMFLPAGRIKVQSSGPDDLAGDVKIAIVPARPATEEPVDLLDDAPIETSLSDHQERRFNVTLSTPQVLMIEAAGRRLDELALWQDGWRVKTQSETETVDSTGGKPLIIKRLWAELPAGVYQVSAYGAAGSDWSEADTAEPLIVTRGIRRVDGTTTTGTIGPTGIALWHLPNPIDTAYLSLPEIKPFRMSLGPCSETDPFSADAANGAIDKDSRRADLWLTASASEDAGCLLAILRGTPGQNYTLQTGQANYARASHARTAIGAVADGLDATALRFYRQQRSDTIDMAAVVELASDRPYRRRFNLLTEESLLIHVAETGAWRSAGEGPGFELQFDTVLNLSENYRRPPFRPAGEVFTLAAGWYRLTIKPHDQEQGIASLSLYADGSTAPAEDSPRPGNLPAAVDEARYYSLITGEVDQLRWVAPVVPPADKPVADQPVTLPPAPEFPVLILNGTKPLDLSDNISTTAAFTLPQAGLWRLETLGRLHTSLMLRNRFDPELSTAATNGPGHNAVIERWLPAGDYRVDIAAIDGTSGPAGLTLRTGRMRDLPAIAPDRAAHAVQATGEALAVPVPIETAGEWQVSAFSLAGDLPVRLEDADGFPIVPPEQTLPSAMDLTPGQFRLVLSPGDLERRITVAIAPPDPVPPIREGHGPFSLPPNANVSHVWTEPTEIGAERLPDVWQFALTAETEMAISLSHGMAGTLTPGDLMVSARVPLKTTLKPGDYQLAVRSIAPDNRRNYDLTLVATDLLPGDSRSLSVPGSLTIAAPGGGIDLFSTGRTDLAATLFDEAGRLVARSGNDGDDWNMRIRQSLPAGRYRLELTAEGDASETRVHLKTLDDPPPAKPITAVLPDDDAWARWRLDPARQLTMIVTDQAVPLRPELPGPALIRLAGNGGLPKVDQSAAASGSAVTLLVQPKADFTLASPDVGAPLSVSMTAQPIVIAEPVKLKIGSQDLALISGQIMPLTLPRGRWRLSFLLPAGAGLLRNAGPGFASGDAPATLSMTGEEGVMLYGLGTAQIQLMAEETPDNGLWPAQFPHATQVLLPKGNWRGVDGRLGPGQISVLAGAFLAWDTDKPRAQFPAKTVKDGDVVELASQAAAFDIAGDGPQRVTLTLTGKAVIEVTTGDTTRLLTAAGRPVALVAGAGPLHVQLYPLIDAELSGRMIIATRPAEPLAEGLGDPLILAPGDARLFDFTLAAPARIGLGLSATEGRPQLTLFDMTGQPLTQPSAAILQALPAKRYLLLIEAPVDGPPVSLRPSLVGTVPPGDGPPPETIKTYLPSGKGTAE